MKKARRSLMKKKKRNPQDVTLRNIRAASKRVTALLKRIKELEKKVASGLFPEPPKYKR